MAKFFDTINKNFILIVSASMFFGFMYGLVFPVVFLKFFISPCVFLIVYPMSVGLRVEDIFKSGDFKLQLSTQVINFLVIPFLSFGIGLMFFRDNSYAVLGMLLIGLLPTGAGAISWTGISKGNVGSAVKMAIIGPILGAVLSPFYIKFLAGSYVEINLFIAIKRVALVIVLPMLLGILTRKLLLIRCKEKDSKVKFVSVFPSFSMFAIIVIIFIAMALKSKSLVQDPFMFVCILLPLVLLYLIIFTASTLVGKLFFDRESTIALVYGTSMRNLSLSLAVAMNLFGSDSDAILVIAVAYIVQIQIAVWYKKLLGKIFAQKVKFLTAPVV